MISSIWKSCRRVGSDVAIPGDTGVETMKLWSFVIAFIFIAQTGYALELDQMQKMALENRQLVRRYVVNLEKSEKDITTAKSGYYPSVDLSYTTNSLNHQTLSGEDRDNSVLSGAVSMNLFAGFKDKYAIKSAEVLRKVEADKLLGIRQDIQLNVALRYLDVYELKANLKVAEDAYKTLKKLYTDGENRLAVGLIDRNELLKFKVDLDNADITVKQARADLEKSVSLLASEVNAPITLNELTFKDFKEQPAYGDPAQSEKLMLANRSELKALRGAAEAAKLQVEIAKSGYYPRVDFTESYSKYDNAYINGTGDIGSQGEELRTQVVASINLFNGRATESEVGKAVLEVRGLRYDLLEMENTLKTQLKNLYIDYKVSLDNISVAQENIKHAQENLRVTQLKYNEGLQRESDLLDAITNLSRARYNYVFVNRGAFSNYFQITRMVEGFSEK